MAIRVRGFVTLLFLLAAILCYATGYFAGLFFLVATGAFFEMLFWAKLFRKSR
jgi:hypothetical protein